MNWPGQITCSPADSLLHKPDVTTVPTVVMGVKRGHAYAECSELCLRSEKCLWGAALSILSSPGCRDALLLQAGWVRPSWLSTASHHHDNLLSPWEGAASGEQESQEPFARPHPPCVVRTSAQGLVAPAYALQNPD